MQYFINDDIENFEAVADCDCFPPCGKLVLSVNQNLISQEDVYKMFFNDEWKDDFISLLIIHRHLVPAKFYRKHGEKVLEVVDKKAGLFVKSVFAEAVTLVIDDLKEYRRLVKNGLGLTVQLEYTHPSVLKRLN